MAGCVCVGGDRVPSTSLLLGCMQVALPTQSLGSLADRCLAFWTWWVGGGWPYQ